MTRLLKLLCLMTSVGCGPLPTGEKDAGEVNAVSPPSTRPECGPQTCTGCCLDGVCRVIGLSTCGLAGSACVACDPFGEFCSTQGVCTPFDSGPRSAPRTPCTGEGCELQKTKEGLQDDRYCRAAGSFC